MSLKCHRNKVSFSLGSPRVPSMQRTEFQSHAGHTGFQEIQENLNYFQEICHIWMNAMYVNENIFQGKTVYSPFSSAMFGGFEIRTRGKGRG